MEHLHYDTEDNPHKATRKCEGCGKTLVRGTDYDAP